MLSRSLYAVPALLLWAQVAEAQVVITEVAANTPSAGDDEEWVEIQNLGAAPVAIDGYSISDYSGANQARRYSFPAGTTLTPGQVIIVTRQATAYLTIPGFPAPSFELALGADDAAVPNMTPAAGGAAWALGNAGDTLVLENAAMTVISAVEWGTGAGVPGTPAAVAPASQSLGRVANTGTAADWASIVHFAVLATPTPGVGYAGPTPTPPSITSPTRAGANWSFGDTVTFGATITDADGIGGAEFNIAIATASTGIAATSYASLAAANTPGGNIWTASGVVQSLVQPTLVFAAPTGFHERYVRWFVYALDNNASDATLPATAVVANTNTAYYWENVLPAATIFPIADARAQGANERPLWEHHSVRIQGVALTSQEAFATGRTNFFISSPTSVDAIRIFDDVLIAQAINPGDLVTVTGKIGVFSGVRQVGRREPQAPPDVAGSELTIVVNGTGAIPTRNLTVGAMLAAGEANESQLVELAGLTWILGPTGEPIPVTFAGNTSYFASDGTGTVEVRITNNVDLVGAGAPGGTFGLRGILTQSAPTGVGGYRLQPRSGADIIGGTPPPDGGSNDGAVIGDGGDPDALPGDTGDSDAAPPADTGTGDGGVGDTGRDTGVPGDTGVVGDTGTGSDVGPGADGGNRPDTGVFGGGKSGGGDSGCGCTTGRPADVAPWAMLLAGGLVVRRRRR